ncbi:barren-domain-containing protein [Nadsonia fulvescens var. elongata DSM 6958]|uniref:Condensin complex subunit 2 n=1 Tax=Nadsonia fulvescens var. elongata DSM 6958 TaxID=857566 RepID=A0A1E3PCR0_9ASCO|nr:barren-domain-containing protein [Nadsonia fulvescens var. elongata DSM 6958]
MSSSRRVSGRFRADTTTGPLRKLVHLNDDQAEKQQRRRTSNQGVDIAVNSTGNAIMSGGSRRPSGFLSNDLSLLPDDGPESLPMPTQANYEEWLKLAKDNKINAANSWNFALIDYFYDMSLLKEGDGVNFQKASVTLDGCVKIYTSRVDSAANETDKLLSGLAVGKHLKLVAGGDEEEDENNINGHNNGLEHEQNGDNKDTTVKPVRKSKRSGDTLVKDFNIIRLKKLELELSIDPLFKKMCADFDEGGAKGLLMNSLTLDRNGRVIFDGDNEKGNCMDDDESEEELDNEENSQIESDEEMDSLGNHEAVNQDLEPLEHTESYNQSDDSEHESEVGSEYESEVEDVDLDYLQETFFPNLSDLQQMELCPSLKKLGTAITDPAVSQNILKHLEDIQINQSPADDDIDTKLQGEFDGDIGYNDQDANDDNSSGGLDAFGFDDNDFESNLSYVSISRPDARESIQEEETANIDLGMSGTDNMEMDNENINTFQPSISKQMPAGSLPTSVLPSLSQAQDLLAYFDETLKRNWAGPEHWKIRRLKQDMAKPTATGLPAMEMINEDDNISSRNNIGDTAMGTATLATVATTPASGKRRAKQALEINFLDWAEDPIDEIKLFAQSSTAANIKMPWTQWKSKSRHLLPDDRHFSSQNLIKLFLKPSGVISQRIFRGNNRQKRELPMAVGVTGLPTSQGSDNTHIIAQRPSEVNDIMVGQLPEPEINADEHFWAQQYQEQEMSIGLDGNGDDGDNGDDDDGPMIDFGNEDMNMMTASFSPTGLPFDENAAATLTIKGEDTIAGISFNQSQNPFIMSQDLAMMDFGKTLVTGSARITRPDYVSYAKVAKKVDIKRLRDNMWKMMPPQWEVVNDEDDEANEQDDDDDWDDNDEGSAERARARERRAQARAMAAAGVNLDIECKFTQIVNNLRTVYPEQLMSEISTSFCFICMLHLANEKGLVIENNETMTDLIIKKDLTVTKAQLSM